VSFISSFFIAKQKLKPSIIPRNDKMSAIPGKRKFEGVQQLDTASDVQDRTKLPTGEVVSDNLIKSGQVCDYCMGLDLQKALQTLPRTVQGQKFCDLKTAGQYAGDLNCYLCRLFASVVAICPPNTKLHLRIFPQRALLHFPITQNKIPQSQETFLGVCHGRGGTKFGKRHRHLCFARGIIGMTERHHGYNVVQRIDKEKANFNRITGWLEDCKAGHGDTCGIVDPPSTTTTRVIDCEARRMVEINLQDEYYALSYVWGTNLNRESKDSLQDGSQLPHPIPQVIEDSISAVLLLNGRYLWVDKFCVDQQNAVKRHRQINSMKEIYESAVATIIAAAGEDVSYGLPGINGKGRQAQLSARIADLELTSGLSRLPVVLENSKWASRGWTYQEAVLSRRCIYFTDEQVYFTCKCSQNCEAVNFTQADQQFTKRLTSLSTDIFDTDIRAVGRRRQGLWNFFDHLYHYKSRELSYRTDSLNAFRGILAKFPYLTVAGVPIAAATSVQSHDEDGLTNGFARGLWWARTKTQ
jgi:hypothetical protein